MHTYTVTVAFISLALLNVVRAQVSTADIAAIGFQDDNLQGQAVGTGADGTTYILSGTFGTFDAPFTVTVVEDATHVSEHAVVEMTEGTLNVNIQCGLSGNNAICTEEVSEGTDATTQTISGTFSSAEIPVVTGSNTFPSSSTAASVTFSSASATGSDSLSVLPAQITVTTKTSATVTSGISSSSGSSSSASRVMDFGINGAGAGIIIAGLGVLFSTAFVTLSNF